MSKPLDSSALDKVLQSAVDDGAVPHVAAVAADRDGIVYEGGAGAPAVGRDGTVDHRYAVPDRVDDQDGRDRGGAPASASPGNLDVDAPVAELLPGVRRRPGPRRLRRRHPTDAGARHPGDRPPTLTHTSGLGYWFFERRPRPLGAGHRHPERPRGRPERSRPRWWPIPCTGSTYGINTDWLGKVVEAVSRQGLDIVVKEKITGPLGMDDTMFLLEPASTGTP